MGLQNIHRHDLHRQLTQESLPDPINSMLCMLTAIIIADQRCERSECITFLEQTRALALSQRLGHKFSDARLVHWYELNKDNIRETLRIGDFESWYFDVLNRLSCLSDKAAILKLIHTVSVPNKTAHKNGQALLRLTEHYWDL